MSSLSHCQQCGRRLRDAYFCPLCGQSQCCFACLDEHFIRHGIVAANRVGTARSAVEDADFAECPENGIVGAPRARRSSPFISALHRGRCGPANEQGP
jgi:hypothetical protein